MVQPIDNKDKDSQYTWVSAQVTTSQLRRATVVACMLGVSRSELIRNAIEQYCDMQELAISNNDNNDDTD